MNNIDFDHDQNLKELRKLVPQLEKLLAYDDEGLPADLDHPPTGLKGLKEIDAYSGWSAKVSEKGYQVIKRIDALQVVGDIRENFYELENEKLPEEGNPGHEVGQ